MDPRQIFAENGVPRLGPEHKSQALLRRSQSTLPLATAARCRRPRLRADRSRPGQNTEADPCPFPASLWLFLSR